MRLRRPELATETLVLLAALYLLAACNLPFWRAALAGRDLAAPGTWALAAAMFVAFGALYVAAAGLLATRHTVRPLLAALILVAAGISYYTGRYAVFFNRDMLRNVLATHWGEARELLGPAWLLHMALFGLLPAALLWWPRLRERPLRRALLVRAAWLVGALALAIGALLPVFGDFASLMRNHREIRHLLTPGNAVAATASHLWGHKARPAVLQPVGEDASLAATGRPRLLVVVVGETARAQNFPLNGYGRDTAPELARRQVVNFADVTACGTSTEVSLPCMFSQVGRRRYDEDRILSQESLLHVLTRAGVQVLWRDNQSGCKGVCAGLPTQDLAATLGAARCPGGECLDEQLLDGLDGVAAQARGSLVVVLHQLGSHGPSYFRRYPPAFRRFEPACESDDLRRCTQAEIVNAYDNSILYTDHVLGRVIDWLQGQQQRYDTAMLYVSDHGESLGEGGLYLHGVPWSIAPAVQTKVPMVAWFSPGWTAATGLDLGCLRRRAAQPASHDHLFHSVLGALDVRTRAYEPDWDLLRPCRPR
jgi:lipid A ethanolaminephosphotransferase